MTRLFVALFVGFTLLAAPLPAGAQTGRTYRVALVRVGEPGGEGEPYVQTFRTAMRDLGYVEGSNLTVDVRWADRDVRRLPALLDEVIALKPDVLVGWESLAQVLRTKTTSIPIVLSGALDPVKAGLAQSLRRPGMNVTGVTQLNDQLPAKHIEILREILPRLARVGQLVDENAFGCKLVEEQARQAARSVGAVLIPYHVANRGDLERAFSQMEKNRPDALLPCPTPVLFAFRDLLFENVVRLRIPLTSFVVANVPVGVLFAYATSLHEMYRRAATYVDKILKGAKPSDLPIEQPTKFELVLNLKTAKALGLTIPQSVLVRADEIIQ
jgi:putative ABC transport system substrate-binding protein